MITGCCCDCRLTTFAFQLCGVPVRSTDVSFTMGATTLTGTTNVYGQVTIQFPSDGDWDYVLMIGGDTTGYQHLTGTVNVTCGAHNYRSLDPGCSFPAVLTYHGSVGQSEAGFYFVLSSVTQPEPAHTLTWQTRPTDIPRQLELDFFTASSIDHITMPSEAWFSEPIDSLLFGNPGATVYFYAWRTGCSLNVMVIYTFTGPYGTVAAGAGNLIHKYNQTSCVPFEMKEGFSGPVMASGTHGGDDITALNAGFSSNARAGLAYSLMITLIGGTGPGHNETTVGHDIQGILSGNTPDYPITWGSSDTAVFTVVGGATSAIVHPVGAGTANLTAANSDPDCSPNSASASVIVH